MLLGVDVGGTFTDAVLFDGRAPHTAKAPTTPDDQSRGCSRRSTRRSSARAPSRAGRGLRPRDDRGHQRAARGARRPAPRWSPPTGFTDLLDVARQNRPELYRLCAPKPSPLVADGAALRRPRAHRPRGRDRAARRRRARPAGGGGAGRRRRVGRRLPALLLPRPGPRAGDRRAPARASCPDVHVSASHEVLPQFREYERCSTTVIDAYLSPLLGRYLGPARRPRLRARAPGARW